MVWKFSHAGQKWVDASLGTWMGLLDAECRGRVWFWSDYMDWFWTDAVTYPFIYASESQSWLYFYGRIENRLLFYRYSDNQWLMKGIEGTE